eukprot:TRINITY_DN59_c1_g2_i2.p2 TRINITY_DN59_c1_g2~~TRINITY_DN59_c1_g2_i2.p2  ORF type:complete len:151 (-),score=29.07 TRINITY_DN59_c1_g2_i2:890-1342(-)
MSVVVNKFRDLHEKLGLNKTNSAVSKLVRGKVEGCEGAPFTCLNGTCCDQFASKVEFLRHLRREKHFIDLDDFKKNFDRFFEKRMKGKPIEECDDPDVVASWIAYRVKFGLLVDLKLRPRVGRSPRSQPSRPNEEKSGASKTTIPTASRV